VAARLTIVIPTYNRADLLVRALESALAQTSDEICIFVSDNASTDGTWDRLASYSDHRLRCVLRPHNTSRIEHGKLILPEVDTEFHVCLSDDDWLEPDFSERVLNLFDRHPECSMVYTGTWAHFDSEFFADYAGPEIEISLEFINAFYAHKRYVYWCACVCRTDALKKIGLPPDDVIFGDLHFWTKIAFQGPVGCVAAPLAHYTAMRPGGDNQCMITPITDWAEEIRTIQREVMALARVHGATDKYCRTLQQNMDRYYRMSVSSQFVFARLHGARWIDTLRAIPRCYPPQEWTLASIPRAMAATILPRNMLRRAVLRSAARRHRQVSQ
jgi:hypothetical protein